MWVILGVKDRVSTDFASWFEIVMGFMVRDFSRVRIGNSKEAS